MASGDYIKLKEDLHEDTRTDSGIESLKSISSTKDDQSMNTVRNSASECSAVKDKFINTEERLDSDYDSSVDSLSEIVEALNFCTNPEEHESVQEENQLTTITEDGDTYVLNL